MPTGGAEVYLYSFFDLGTRGWVVTATPRPLHPAESGAVPTVPEAGWTPGPSERVRKISPHRDSIPGSSSPWQGAIPTTLSRLFCLLDENVNAIQENTEALLVISNEVHLYQCFSNRVLQRVPRDENA